MLLSVLIPTFNRHKFLSKSLKFLVNEYEALDDNERKQIEIIISDNSDNNLSKDLVTSFFQNKLPLKYFKNEVNLAVDENLKKLFKYASGKFIIFIADDDHVINFSIKPLLNLLKVENKVDVAYLKTLSYSDDEDFYPQNNFKIHGKFLDLYSFVKNLNINLTFMSSFIIKKELISLNQDNINELTFFIFLVSALKSKADPKLFITKNYVIRAKRNNAAMHFNQDGSLVSGYREAPLKDIYIDKFLQVMSSNFDPQLFSDLKKRIFFRFYLHEIYRRDLFNDPNLKIALDTHYHNYAWYRFLSFFIYSRKKYNRIIVLFLSIAYRSLHGEFKKVFLRAYGIYKRKFRG
tara:strand:- start:13641 stop:14684 length:1044 start_codon:yes stop_codon:yes gene_type:complete